MKPLHENPGISDAHFLVTIDRVDVYSPTPRLKEFILATGKGWCDWDYMSVDDEGYFLGVDIDGKIPEETLTKIFAYINLIS